MIIGLTGGIGSGKSVVGAILAELGAHVIDTDKVGHRVYAPGSEGFEATGPEPGSPEAIRPGSEGAPLRRTWDPEYDEVVSTYFREIMK